MPGWRPSGIDSSKVHVIKKVGLPIRSQEIMVKLPALDTLEHLHLKLDPDSSLSVVLAKGVTTGRLKTFKVPGSRGGCYAVEDWLDKERNLNDEMRKSYSNQ